MHIKTRNVNTGFFDLVCLLWNGGQTVFHHNQFMGSIPRFEQVPVVERPSRNGTVRMFEEPILITYEKPLERVLFNPARDANPFFHLYEALWMLAGRNDVEPLAYYAKQIREYSDDGKTLNGAYGYRWRHAYLGYVKDAHGTVDQLDLIVEHLTSDWNSRRAVLQMWNVEDDLLQVGKPCKQCNGTGVYKGKYTPDDPNSPVVEETCEDCDGAGKHGYSKDVCCNLSVMFSVRTDPVCPTCQGNWTEVKAHRLDETPPSKGGVCPNCGGDPNKVYLPRRWLDMTVTNRSNDMIWGLLGANYVHFTVLQEYLAARLGPNVEVGLYHHFTNNLHAYSWNWDPEKWMAVERTADGGLVPDRYKQLEEANKKCKWTVPLVQHGNTFDAEVGKFVERHQRDAMGCEWAEGFLYKVAQPACCAYHHYKRGEIDRALTTTERIRSEDWKMACMEWLLRRAAAKKGVKL